MDCLSPEDQVTEIRDLRISAVFQALLQRGGARPGMGGKDIKECFPMPAHGNRDTCTCLYNSCMTILTKYI